MIKIDTDLFEWNEIEKIYKDTIVKEIRDKIDNYIRQDNNLIVKKILKNWFCESGVNQSNEEIIHDYLVNPNLNEKIEDFNKILCDQFGKQLFDIMEKWTIIQNEVFNSKNYKIRKKKITTIINEDTIDMFDNITLSDLNVEPKKGTIYSNKEKIKKIKINQIDKIKKELSSIFDYKGLCKKFRNKLLKAMNISVCPYCNRQYITTFGDDENIRATADIDHFYNKDTYPFLSLSLYNFIPSCQICNSRFKLISDFYTNPHINPYKKGFDNNAIFKISNIKSLIDTKTVKPKYELVNLGKDCKEKIEIDNSINTFKLNSVYQSHDDYVQELIIKSKIYSDKQLKQYLTKFKFLFETKEEMLRIIYGTYLQQEDIGKRPLSKLTRDILIDLGVINNDEI